MKKLKLLFICLSASAIIFSCSDKDDPKPAQNLEEIDLTVFSEENKVNLPEGLKTSTSSEAQLVSSMIEGMTANIGAYSALFAVPDGATKINSPIKATNGRMNATTVTYEWSYDGGAIAYQITELDNSYFFEMFFKEATGPYKKWFEGTQAKDGKSGSFVMLNFDLDTRSEIFTYQYEIRGDGSIYGEYNFNDGSSSASMVFEVKANGSGYMKTYNGTTLQVHYLWNVDGSGSWTYYDEAGAVSSTGTWTAG